MEVTKLEREFRYNGVKIQDPGPTMTPEQVKNLLSAAYPDLTSAQIEGPVTEGGKLVYEFRRAVGTKGSSESDVEFSVEQKHGMLYIKVDPEKTRREAERHTALARIGEAVDRVLFPNFLGAMPKIKEH